MHVEINALSWTHIPVSSPSSCQLLALFVWQTTASDQIRSCDSDITGPHGLPADPWIPATHANIMVLSNLPFSKENTHRILQVSKGFGITKREIISNLEDPEGPSWLLYWYYVSGFYAFKTAKEIWHAILISKILSSKTKSKSKKTL